MNALSKGITFTLFLVLGFCTCYSQNSGWTIESTPDESHPSGLDETSYVLCNEKMYLIGGRGNLPIEEYDPIAKTWVQKAKTPNLNHFQAVSVNNKIYIVCAFTGGYPTETPVSQVYVFDPESNEVSPTHLIPEGRRRGSAGAVVYNNKIYVVCGITNGHTDGHVAWFDEYDPSTGDWTPLPDAPRARDHFNAAVIDDKLYVVSGRVSSYPQTFNFTVPEVDIYDFKTGKWSTGPNNIPTQRAGTAVVAFNNDIMVIGGESMSHLEAHDETEALNTQTLEWHTMPSLNNGRHGTQAVVYNHKIYIASGVGNRGGNPKLDNQEIFSLVITGSAKPKSAPFIMAPTPNPVDDSFILNKPLTKNNEYVVILYNIQGTSVYRRRFKPGQKIFLPLDTPKGLYLGKITSLMGDFIGSFSFSKL